ncbi:MAG TPA: PKD domain-containing protein, partial [Candidatus Marinimicrobia bacterium]|nr:PKD domain-containing protein [Candidatus Neomarinimicrobiota bacterium]
MADTSQLPEPSYTYLQSGTYYAGLIVTDKYNRSSSVIKPVSITVTLPSANFCWETNFLEVSFTDESTEGDATITSWSWDFGDGSTSTEQDPAVHAYADAGTY